METVQIDNIEFSFELGKLIPQEVWQGKEEWEEGEKRAIKEWEAMSNEAREAAIALVERSLQAVMDKVDSWIPSSFELKQGEYLDCKFRMIFTDLEHETLARDALSERKIRAAAESARELAESPLETPVAE